MRVVIVAARFPDPTEPFVVDALEVDARVAVYEDVGQQQRERHVR
jgi:hypothetical protein